MSMEWEKLIPRPSSRFLRIRCKACESEQIVFSHTTHAINCRTCGETLAQPTGGKARINGIILSILG
jgi:small subunit ribosomal protein S27e